MSIVLKVVSAVYLAIIWAICISLLGSPVLTDVALRTNNIGSLRLIMTAILLSAVLLSIPAIALYAFGQLVGDTRVIRNSLAGDRIRIER